MVKTESYEVQAVRPIILEQSKEMQVQIDSGTKPKEGQIALAKGAIMDAVITYSESGKFLYMTVEHRGKFYKTGAHWLFAKWNQPAYRCFKVLWEREIALQKAERELKEQREKMEQFMIPYVLEK